MNEGKKYLKQQGKGDKIIDIEFGELGKDPIGGMFPFIYIFILSTTIIIFLYLINLFFFFFFFFKWSKLSTKKATGNSPQKQKKK